MDALFSPLGGESKAGSLMDTPDKKTQPSPSSLISKFEDSPVFNYLSNLSPLTPFNLSRSGRSFHAVGFSSPLCLQNSPLSCHDESNIKSATNVSDVLKNDCSQSGNKDVASSTSGAELSTTEEVDRSDSTGGEVTVNETNESSEVGAGLPESWKYDRSSPNDIAGQPHCEFNSAIAKTSPVKTIEDVSKEAGCSYENETGVEGNKQECNWDKFISEASDVLDYQTPAKNENDEELDDKSMDSGTRVFVATVLQPPNDGAENPPSVCHQISSKEQDVEVPFSQPGVANLDNTSQVPAAEKCVLLAEQVVHYSSTEEYDKQQQMTSRRCLVYEMSGAHYRQMQLVPADTFPTSTPSANLNASIEKGVVANASRPGDNKFSSQLPGIGLHLNALAASSRDKIIVKSQTLTCRRQLISSPSTVSSFDAPACDPKPISIIKMPPDSARMTLDEQNDAVQVSRNVDQNSAIGEDIEFHLSSPKKKRRKSENVGEGDSCKRCNCKRSKCLKLYCECFAAGLYCVEPCNCQDCLNKPIHEETVLETRRQIESRNPLAFAPKVIKCSSTLHNGDELKTPASARHKRGCNCKKSGCLKKYCECFQGGVGCSLSCRCEGCKNTFGQKEGIESLFGEHVFQKHITDASSHNKVLATVEKKNEDEAALEAPRHVRSKPTVTQPFQFGEATSETHTHTEFHSTLKPCCTTTSEGHKKLQETGFEEEDVKKAHPKDEDEDEATTPTHTPTLSETCVTSTSPNSKRVSPPHYDLQPSPGWKSCRKLILKSISSLPASITQKKATKLHREPQ